VTKLSREWLLSPENGHTQHRVATLNREWPYSTTRVAHSTERLKTCMMFCRKLQHRFEFLPYQ
jgi:hypothetical protein